VPLPPWDRLRRGCSAPIRAMEEPLVEGRDMEVLNFGERKEPDPQAIREEGEAVEDQSRERGATEVPNNWSELVERIRRDDPSGMEELYRSPGVG
jgi:hypothetical protein